MIAWSATGTSSTAFTTTSKTIQCARVWLESPATIVGQAPEAIRSSPADQNSASLTL